MKIKCFPIVLILLIAQFANGQNSVLKGKIVDSKNGNSISGATVFISFNYFTYTNGNGEYRIDGLPNGLQEIKVSSLGYKAISKTIDIDSSEVKEDFQLEPSLIELDEVVVSTNRSEDYLRNSPFAELVVDKEEIQTRSSVSLPDILQNEPGISLVRDGIWGTEISIRGLSRENIITLD